MPAIKIIGCIALGLLTALAFGYVFLYLLSKSLDWLDAHYGMKIRRLLKVSLQKSYNNGGYKRGKPEYRIYLQYLSQSARRILKWDNKASHIHMRSQNKNRANQHSNARPKGFVQTRHFPSCRILSHSSISNRLRKEGKTRTKSNDLANKIGLFAIVLGIGGFCTIAGTQLTLPVALRVNLLAVSIAGLFVVLFSLRPNKDYKPSSPKDSATDKNLIAVTLNYPNNYTGYHQTYAKPLHAFHIFLSLLRHIISYCKLRCQLKWKGTVSSAVFASETLTKTSNARFCLRSLV